MIEPIKYDTKFIWKTYYKANGGKLDYATYKAIIAQHNKEIAKLIIEVGFEYITIHSDIRVVRNKRHIAINEEGNIRGAIDWFASKQLKQKFIEEGKLPYESYKDENGKVTGDNGGEKWLVYRTDEFYYSIIGSINVFVVNNTKYKFIASWTNQRTLVASITEDSEFLYRDTDGTTGKRDFITSIAAKSRDYVRVEQQ